MATDSAPMIRTFKIQRSQIAEPLFVRGRIIAEGVGVRHVVQVIQTDPDRKYVVVLADYVDGWLLTEHFGASKRAALVDCLRSVAEGEPVPTVRALVTERPDSPQVRQDLREAVDQVLRIVGGHPERPRSAESGLDLR